MEEPNIIIDMTNYNDQLYDAIKRIIHDDRIPLYIRDEYRNKIIKAKIEGEK